MRDVDKNMACYPSAPSLRSRNGYTQAAFVPIPCAKVTGRKRRHVGESVLLQDGHQHCPEFRERFFRSPYIHHRQPVTIQGAGVVDRSFGLRALLRRSAHVFVYCPTVSFENSNITNAFFQGPWDPGLYSFGFPGPAPSLRWSPGSSNHRTLRHA